MVSIAAMEIAKKKHVVIEADGFERKGPTTSKNATVLGIHLHISGVSLEEN